MEGSIKDKVEALSSRTVLSKQVSSKAEFNEVVETAKTLYSQAKEEHQAKINSIQEEIKDKELTEEESAAVQVRINEANEELEAIKDNVKHLVLRNKNIDMSNEQVKKSILVQTKNDLDSNASLGALYRKLGSGIESFTQEEIDSIEDEKVRADVQETFDAYNAMQDVFKNVETDQVHSDIMGSDNQRKGLRSLKDHITNFKTSLVEDDSTRSNKIYERVSTLLTSNESKLAYWKDIAEQYKATPKQKEVYANLLTENNQLKATKTYMGKVLGIKPVAALSDSVAVTEQQVQEAEQEVPSTVGLSMPSFDEVLARANAKSAAREAQRKAEEVAQKEEESKPVETKTEAKVEEPAKQEPKVQGNDGTPKFGGTKLKPKNTNTLKLLRTIKQVKDDLVGSSKDKLVLQSKAELKASLENIDVSQYSEEVKDLREVALKELDQASTLNLLRELIKEENATEDMFTGEPVGVFDGVMNYLTESASKFKVYFKGKASTLSKHKNLLSEIKKELLTENEVARFILNENGVTEENLESVSNVINFLNKFNKQFEVTNALSFMGKDGEAKVSDWIRDNNPLSALLERDAEGALVLNENVKTALAYAVLLELNENKSLTALRNEDSVINIIQKKKDKDPVDLKVADMLREKGTPMYLYADTIGERVVEILGIKIDKSNEFANEKLVTALGNAGLYTLVGMGLFEANKVSLNTFIVKGENQITQNLASKANNDNVTFIRIKPSSPVYEDADLATLALDNDGEVINKLFGADTVSIKPLVHLTPPKATDSIKRSGKKLPKALVEKVQKQNNQPHVVSDTASLFMLMTDDQQLKMSTGSYGEKFNKQHKSAKDSAQAAADGVEQNIKIFKRLFNTVTGEFYTGNEASSNRRLSMDTKIDTMQSKVHRWLVSLSAWKAEYDVNDLGYFHHAVVAAFDGKIDIWAYEKTVSEFHSIYNSALVQRSLDEIDALEEGRNTDLSATLELNIQYKTNLHLLAGLKALSNYRKALKDKALNGNGKFTSDLTLEVDGKTNGFSFSLIQYITEVTDSIKEQLNRTGVLTGGFKDLAQYYGNKAEDSYQLIARNLNNLIKSKAGIDAIYKAISKAQSRGNTKEEKILIGLNLLGNGFNKKLEAISAIVGDLVDADGSVTKAGRNYAKSPLMTWNYNAGKASIARNFASDAMDNFYSKLAQYKHDFANLKTKQERDALRNEFNNYINNMAGIINTPLRVDINKADEFLLTQDQFDKFAVAIQYTYGETLNKTMSETFPELHQSRSNVNDVIYRINEMFAVIYHVEVLKYLNSVKDQGIFSVSDQAKKDILLKLENLIPEIQGYGSDYLNRTDWMERNKFTDNIASAESKAFNESYLNQFFNSLLEFSAGKKGITFTPEVKVNPRELLFGKNSVGEMQFNKMKPIQATMADGTVKSFNSAKITPEMSNNLFWESGGKIGVAPVLIHNLDAAVIMELMEIANIYNLNDAVLVSPKEAKQTIENINRIFKEVNENYSITRAVSNTASDFSFALKQYLDTSDKVTKYHLERLFDYKEYADGGVIEYKGINGLNKLMSAIDYRSTRVIDNTEAKQELIDSIESWTQYSLPSAEYVPDSQVVTDENVTLDDLNDELESVLKDVFGSTNTPVGNMNVNTVVDITTVQETINTLDSLQQTDITPTTTEHHSYLKGLIEVLGSTMEPVKVLLGKAGTSSLGDYDAATKTLRVKRKAIPIAARRGMSDAEVFTHEMVHHLIEPFIDFKNKHTDRLRFLFDVAKKHITYKDLIELDANGKVIANPTQAQIDDAKAMWSYVFENTQYTELIEVNPITGVQEKRVKHNGFSEFLAHLSTNRQFMIALSNNQALNAEFKKGKRIEFAKTNAKSSLMLQMSEFVIAGIQAVMDFIASIGDYFDRNSGENAHATALRLMQKMTQTQEQGFMQRIKLFENKIDLNEKAKNFAINTMSSQGINRFIQATANANPNTIKGFPVFIMNKAASSIAHAANSNKAGASEAIDNFISAFAFNENNILISVAREIQGRNKRTSTVHLLRQVTQRFIDSMRISVRTNFKKYVQDLFDGQLDAQTDKDMYYGILRTDLGLFTRNKRKDLDKLISYLDSDNALNDRIKELEKELTDNWPANEAKYYANHARSLGHYMITDKHLYNCSANNAHLIANMKTAQNLAKNTGSVKRAEEIIDEIATLQAVHYSNTRAALKQLASNKERFETLLEIQNKLVEFSDSHLFTNDSLKRKGYVTDMMHPKYTLEFAYGRHQLNAMLANGLELVYDKTIEKDPLDPNKEEVFVLVNKQGALDTLTAGVFSYTSEKARGSDLIDVANETGTGTSLQNWINGQNDIKGYKTNALIEIQNQLNGNFTSGDNIANPIYNEKGKVVNYRYEMKHSTRVEALKLQPSFSDVTGNTMAHSKDKVNTKLINRLAVDSLKKDYDKFKNKPRDLQQYVFIGRQSTDPKLRELWFKLPYDTQLHIMSTWGEQGMYVRERSLNDIFGYRELRVRDITESLNKRFNNKFFETMNKYASHHKFLRGEDITYEAMKMVKDVIVVKSCVTGLFNISSNIILTATKTGSLFTTVTNMLEGYKYANEYMRLSHEVDQLSLKLQTKKMAPDEYRAVLSEKLKLQDQVHNNPIHFLIKNGVFQTVVEDMDSENELFSYTTELMEKTEKYTNKVPEFVKDLAKFGLVTHDTRLYKGLFKLVQFGDFTARYALYLHNKENGMSDLDNINDIMETYVDYDYATHPFLSFLNRLNIMMFTKYIIRIQKILVKTAIDRPLSILAMSMGQAGLGDVEDPYDTILTLQNSLNRMTNPIDAVINAAGDTITMAALVK